MADDTETQVPWYSWLFLAFHLTVTIGILWMTHSFVLSKSTIWIITAVWAVATGIMGLIDFIVSRGSTSVDATVLDRWSLIHFAAGVVFGFWYIPLIFLLIVVVMWECFEFSVAGFGDQEVILNRLSDIGVAVLGWVAVVVFLMLSKGSPFPLASPV